MEIYLPRSRHLDVLELGSGTSPEQTQTHRSLLADVDHSYLGVDVREANNVDLVMRQPYTIPARSRSKDVVICGSVLEHVPFFWASALEVARVLRPGGLWFVTVPSRGHKHTPVDCWRYYPDGMRAIAAASRLTLLESHTHFPPMTDNLRRHRYSGIDVRDDYWGDTVAVYQKPERYPIEMNVIRPVVRWWANRASREGPLGATPYPHAGCPVPAARSSQRIESGVAAPASSTPIAR
ncbi:methyltransferase domain-containing protein [uncultured Jatrophihabitans sp.]|uniref:methyltransferase domain-containing protein n=1 Tax=uncultured Jatrophihabitans sp. TaxID=1610747 RepID=UPI0035CA5BF6